MPLWFSSPGLPRRRFHTIRISSRILTNLCPDRKLAYRHLADSNLDWRGNEWYLAEYIRRHPGTIVDPRKPQAGRIVVPVNALVGSQSRS